MLAVELVVAIAVNVLKLLAPRLQVSDPIEQRSEIVPVDTSVGDIGDLAKMALNPRIYCRSVCDDVAVSHLP